MRIQKIVLTGVLLATAVIGFAQTEGVSIKSTVAPPHTSAMLDIDSETKGLLIPRVALEGVEDNSTIANPAHSLLVYCNGNGNSPTKLPKGYFYNAGTESAPYWTQIASGIGGGLWSLASNGTDVYRATGNVGIGIDAPASKLHVTDGLISVESNTYTGVTAYTYSDIPNEHPSFITRRGKGSKQAPTHLENYDVIGAFVARSVLTNPLDSWGTGIKMRATENHTDYNQGAQMVFTTIPNGTINSVDHMVLDHNGNLGLGVTSNIGKSSTTYNASPVSSEIWEPHGRLHINTSVLSPGDPFGMLFEYKNVPGYSDVDFMVSAGNGSGRFISSGGLDVFLNAGINTNESEAEFKIHKNDNCACGNERRLFAVTPDYRYYFGNNASPTEYNRIMMILANTVEGKGATNHEIFSWPTVANGDPGAMYVSVGASANGDKNNFYIYDGSQITPGDNWVKNIYLRAHDTHVSGNLNVSGTFTNSDSTLKKNIATINTALNKVAQLRPVNFNWKVGDSSLQTGFIAQEVQSVYPELVSSYTTAIIPNQTGGGETKLSVNYVAMVPLLVKSIQEQQALIEALEARIAALEAQ